MAAILKKNQGLFFRSLFLFLFVPVLAPVGGIGSESGGAGLKAGILPMFARRDLAGVEANGFQPVIPPSGPALRRPVRMVFSAHGSGADARWAFSEAEKLIRDIPPGRPVVIWLEHAYPAGIPASIAELQQRYGSKLPPGRTWCEEILRNPLDRRTAEILDGIYYRAQPSSYAGAGAFFTQRDPFFDGLRQGVVRMRGLGHRIRIRAEEPSFDAYVDYLRHQAMGSLTAYWVDKPDPGRALSSLAAAYRFFSAFLDRRDERLAADVAEAHKKDPSEVQIIFRGLAHERGMRAALLRRGIRSLSSAQGPKRPLSADSKAGMTLHEYLFRYRTLPSLGHAAGARFIASQLLAIRQERRPA